MNKHVIVFFAFLSILATADTTYPMKTTEWRHYDAQSESIGDTMRVSIPTKKGKWWGLIGRYVDGTSGRYLQVTMGDMESTRAEPQCSNNSTKGGVIGTLHTGTNTFFLPEHARHRQFFLALRLMGNRQAKVGPWVDFKDVRITSTPQNTPVVTLMTGDVARVGSQVKITLSTQEVLAEEPVVRFCLVPHFIDYRFNGQEEIVLHKTGTGHYEAVVSIDSKALNYVTGTNRTSLKAMTIIHGVPRYFTIPFPVEVKTDNPLEQALFEAGSRQVREDRMLWFQRIRGKDLARGCRVTLAPMPEYGLTKDSGDELDLTRGRLTSHPDDRVWFDRKAVGWYMGSTQIYLRVDLKKVCPVEKMVIRLLGGTKGNFRFPSALTLYVSKDGLNFHKATEMKKLSPCEKEQADWHRYYYLDESKEVPNTRMHPFELAVQADARYVLLNITGETGAIFSDALACIQAEKRTSDFNRAYDNPSQQIPMSGLIIRPRVPELAVMKGLPAPQSFVITDMRPSSQRKQKAELVLELPSGLEIHGQQGEQLAHGGKRYTCDLSSLKGVYLFPGQTLPSPTYYLQVTGPVAGKAVIYGRSNGIDQFKTQLPIRLVEPPVITVPFRRLHISLSWMGEKNTYQWPDFLHNWRRLGFNVVSSFPRFWRGATATSQGTRLVEAAHKAGFKVIMNDSSFHEMVRGKKAGHEVYCQIPGRTHTMLCPSYRGTHYRQEMDRVRRCTRQGKPDLVFYDIEIWHQAHQSAPLCTRCKKALAESGKELNDYLYACGAEMMADLKQAIALGAKDAGIPMPTIGSYGRQPLHPKYGIERWETTYPASLDLAQPSLYVAGRALDVHNNIRQNHRLLGNKKLIPFLTAGTYGEFDSFKMEQMVLEALMNGAGGITYFCFNDFTDSPLDFYYHLKALAALAPYEDLVVDGKVTDIAGSNPHFTYSMLVKEKEALLLVGNYAKAAPKTSVRLPFDPVSIMDLRHHTKVQGEQVFTFDVPKGDVQLYHIRFK